MVVVNDPPNQTPAAGSIVSTSCQYLMQAIVGAPGGDTTVQMVFSRFCQNCLTGFDMLVFQLLGMA
jgi:hypothetical protein